MSRKIYVKPRCFLFLIVILSIVALILTLCVFKYQRTNIELSTINSQYSFKIQQLQLMLECIEDQITWYETQEETTSNHTVCCSAHFEEIDEAGSLIEIESDLSVINGIDLDLLARLIYAEAGGSTEEDMMLVGNVVLNRVDHDDFPNTIREVIHQPGQYSTVKTGAIYKKPSEKALEIAKRLLQGERFAPDNVVYQSQSIQGSGVWKKVGVHYYCYK